MDENFFLTFFLIFSDFFSFILIFLQFFYPVIHIPILSCKKFSLLFKSNKWDEQIILSNKWRLISNTKKKDETRRYYATITWIFRRINGNALRKWGNWWWLLHGQMDIDTNNKLKKQRNFGFSISYLIKRHVAWPTPHHRSLDRMCIWVVM